MTFITPFLIGLLFVIVIKSVIHMFKNVDAFVLMGVIEGIFAIAFMIGGMWLIGKLLQVLWGLL